VTGEESMLPVFEEKVVMVIPVFGAVDKGFLTLVTENCMVEVAGIGAVGFILVRVRMSFEKSQRNSVFMF